MMSGFICRDVLRWTVAPRLPSWRKVWVSLDRVTIHPPYRPEDAVIEASRFHVGLCLERAGIRNHELTVSNKIFDYHMAGLAVIASDLPALRDIVQSSGGGLLYHPGDIKSLTEQILMLYRDQSKLQQLSSNARRFALSEGNREHVMRDFSSAAAPLLQQLQRRRSKAVPWKLEDQRG